MLTIASTTLPPEPDSVPAARDLVAGVTEQLPRRAREAVDLVTTELAANCVAHARTAFEVFAASDDGTVEVVVADGADWGPSGSTAPAGASGGVGSGQGLLLVDLLASAWTAEAEGGGKRVWARLLVDDVPTS
jgi:hypothetical protein